jgi:hypothetical protein
MGRILIKKKYGQTVGRREHKKRMVCCNDIYSTPIVQPERVQTYAMANQEIQEQSKIHVYHKNSLNVKTGNGQCERYIIKQTIKSHLETKERW